MTASLQQIRERQESSFKQLLILHNLALQLPAQSLLLTTEALAVRQQELVAREAHAVREALLSVMECQHASLLILQTLVEGKQA